VARRRDGAGALHGREIDWRVRSVTWCEATGPALVLGSTQVTDRDLVPDHAGLGLEVVRRRSGGGAVLVEPGRLVWADVVVPAGDRLWHDDVGRAAWWLGEAWAAALAGLGPGRGDVHRAGLVRSRWSALVCFAGLGPGEVTVGGRKIVGLAQRRTRAGALFQCAVPLAWDPAPLLAALALTPDEREAARAELAGAVLPVDRPPADVEAALLAQLPL
jgi:lipoate-protein ligase A